MSLNFYGLDRFDAEMLRFHNLRYMYFHFFRLKYTVGRFLRFFKPGRFIPHKHLTVFHLCAMDTEITPALHSKLGPISSIVEPGFETSRRVSSLNGLNSKSDCYSYHRY